MNRAFQPLALVICWVLGSGTASAQLVINAGTTDQSVANALAQLGNPISVIVNSGGTLRLTGGSSPTHNFGGDANRIIQLNGGTLQRNSGSSNATLVNRVELTANSFILTNGAASETLTISGQIFGSGGLTKQGSRELILSGSNTFTGATVLNAGDIRLGNLGALAGTSGVTIQNGARLIFGVAGEQNWTLGTGTIVIEAGGTLRHEGAGNIAVLSQTVELQGAGNNRNLFTQGDSRIYLQGGLTGTGGFTKEGNGELRFEGTQKTYSGMTIVNNGRLRIDQEAIPINTSGILLNGGTLRFGQKNVRTYTLGAAGAKVVVQGGGTIEHEDSDTAILTNDIEIGTGNATLRARTEEAGASSQMVFTGDIIGQVAAGAGTVNFNSGSYDGEVVLRGNYNVPTKAVNLANGTLTLGSSTVVNGTAFTMQGISTLKLEIDSPSQFGAIQVTGAATINNGATFRPVFNTGLDGGTTTFDIVQGGSVTANVGALNLDVSNPLVQYSLNNSGTALQLIADVDYTGAASGIALSSNQQAVAGLLGASGGGAAQGQLRGAALNAQGTAALLDFYDSVAAEEMGALSSLAFANSNAQLRNIANRARGARGGGSTMTGTALLDRLQLDPATLLASTQPAAALPQASSRAADASRPEWSAFGNVNVLNGRQSAAEGTRGWETSTQGFTAGADKFIGENFLIGGYGGYDRSRAQFAENGGFARVDSGTFGAYGSWLDGGWQATAAAQYSRHHYETERTSVLGTAKGDTEGDQISLMLAGGYTHQAGRWSLGPTASVTYSHLWVDSFAETGSPIAQAFEAQTAESLQTGIGGKVAYLFPGSFVSLQPEVTAEYRHEFLDDSRGIESSLVGGGPGLVVNTPDPSRDFAVLGGGLNASFADGTTAYVRYEAEVGRSDYVGHGVFGGVRWLFPGGPVRNPVIAFEDDEKDWRDAIMESPVGDAIKLINLSGRLHLQYDYAETEAKAGTNPDPQDPEMINRLFIRRLRLSAQRDLGAGFYVEATGEYDEFAQNRVPLNLFNGLVGWQPIEEFNINFGYDKVPFSYEENTSSARIKTVERSVATRTFTKLGDIGEQHVRLGVNGRFKEILGDLGPLKRYDFHYEAAIAHPSSSADALWDADLATTNKNFVSPSYYLRLQHELRTLYGDIDVGADFGWVPFDFRDNPGAEAIGYSPFINYQFGWFNLMAQWMGLSYTGAPGDRAVDTSGFTIQPSFMVHPKWEIVAMYSQYDTNGDEAIRLNQSARNVPTLSPDSRRFDDISAYYLGFNHFIKGNDIKLSSGVEWIEAEGARPNRPVSAEEALVFRARLQLLF